MRRWVWGVVALAAAVSPAAAQAAPPDWIEVKDGVTQPVFSLDDAVTETLYVETVVDSDQDGRRDRVRIHISRPGETETQGIDVPVVFEHSPYRGDFGDAENHPVDFDVLPQEGLRRGRGGDRTQARRGWGRARAARRPAGRARQPLRPARLRGDPRRGDRLRRVRRLPDDRRLGRGALDAGGHRLAQRPGAGVRRRRAAGARGLDDGGGRDDRRLLRRHAPQHGRDHGRAGPEDDRPDQRRSRVGTTTTAPTGSWWRRTPTPRAWARTSTSARTPTCWRSSPPATTAAPGRARTCCSAWPSSRTARPATRTGSGASATTSGAPATCARASSSSTASTTGT